MTNMFTVDVEEEPKGAVYESLLRIALGFCNQALLVVRPGIGLSASAQDLLTALALNQFQRTAETEWPGTRLFGETADVYRFRYDGYLIDRLGRATDRLYQWQQPDLPEDLCLLRPDGRPWLSSISHEQDAWLEIERDEFQTVSAIQGLKLKDRSPGDG